MFEKDLGNMSECVPASKTLKDQRDPGQCGDTVLKSSVSHDVGHQSGLQNRVVQNCRMQAKSFCTQVSCSRS